MPQAPRLSVVDGNWKRSAEVKLRERAYRVLQKQCLWLQNNLDRINAFKKGQNEVVYRIDPVGHYKINTIHADIDSLLRDMPGNALLVDAITASMALALVRGGNRTIKLMALEKYGISFTLKNPKVAKILQARKNFELSERDGTISQTTHTRIHDILVKGADEGLSYTEMSKQIKAQAVDGVFSKARGERIAVREVGLAYGQGQHEVVQDFRHAHPELSIEKIWITASDDKVRETHRANAQAGYIDYDQMFPGTNEQTAPSQDFGCRCCYSTRIKEETNKVDRVDTLARKVSSISYEIGEVKNNINGIVGVAATSGLLDSKLEAVETRLQNNIEAIELIPGDKGDKGDPGIPGVDGKTPIPGVDFPIPTNGLDSTVPGPQGPQGEPGIGKDGKDGSPDTPKQIVKKLESLKGMDRLDAKAIKNLAKYIGSVPFSSGYGSGNIASIIAGTGLSGGGNTGDVNIALDTAYIDSRYVSITGDTMTGGLTIQPAVDTLTALVVNDKDSNPVLNVDTINNRVGIGTDTPSYILEIWPSATSTVNFQNNAIIGMYCYGSTASTRSQLKGERARGTVASPLTVQNNDYLFSIATLGHDGTSLVQPAEIDFYVDGVPATGSVPARISFVTGTSVADRTERLVIKSDGKIGIGIGAPTSKLHIVGNADTQQLIVKANATQTSSLQEWQNSSAGVLSSVSGLGYLGIGTVPTYPLHLNKTQSDAANNFTGAYIYSTFNVTADTGNNSYGQEIFVNSASGAFNLSGTITGLQVTAQGQATGSTTTAAMVGIGGQTVVQAASTAAYTTISGLNFGAQTYGTGTVTSAYGIQAVVNLRVNGGAADGNITNAYAVWGSIRNFSTAGTPGVIGTGRVISAAAPTLTGAITTLYGFYAYNQGGANVTNAYGLYIAAQSGAATLNYAIYTNAGLVHFGDTVDLASGKNLTLLAGNITTDTTTGSKIGTATTQKLGFWNVTPIIQPASANQATLTNSTGGSYDGTLVDVGVLFNQANINNNFTDVYTLLTEIRTALVNAGIMKGAA